MRRTGKVNWSWRAWLGALTLVLILVAGLSMEQFSIVSHAQSQGKVTASSANIRKEANPSSQVLGSAAKDANLTINHQTKGSDGNTWYQVFVNAETLGYIRADLVTITDGSTPNTVTSTGTSSTTTPNTGTSGTTPSNNETPTEVTAVAPVSASVKGGNQVRVRSNASTTSQIVTTVERGSVLTVKGQATGADSKVWYQVEFISNGAQVSGFIRSDYVDISGELKPPVEEKPEQPTQPEDTGSEETPVVTKDWETQLQGEEWYLLDMVSNGQYNIADLFAAIEQNKAAYEELEVSYKELEGTVKSQKIVVILLVIALIGLGAGVAFLVFKIKDMTDAAYFEAVEKDTMSRRNTDRGQSSRPQGSQKVMHTVGEEKKSVSGGQGTRSGKPAGGQGQGNKPASGKPNGAQQGTRPSGQAQGGRPAGASAQGGRTVMPPASDKASGSKPQGSRPAGAQPQTGRPAPKAQANNPQNKKSKNFMVDDDEFEFEFLNWDGEEE